MLNEKRIRLLIFFIVAVIHIVLIFFLSFSMKLASQTQSENARMMRLVDLSEIEPEPPPPPPPEEIQIPLVESIAETMIETEEVPDQIVVAPGAITVVTAPASPSWDDYLPRHMVTDPPKFNEKEIYADLVYPPIALRSGIEGRVIVELFVDRNGQIQRVLVMQENPQNRGFGEAAVKAFTGKKGTPAYADGKPVSTRYRWPVSFIIK
jgi:periplasmic protein TonB